MVREHISHEVGNDEAWICICGNRPDSDGFYPCDAKGKELEPVAGSGWQDLYACARCRRIIQMSTLEVVGQR